MKEQENGVFEPIEEPQAPDAETAEDDTLRTARRNMLLGFLG